MRGWRSDEDFDEPAGADTTGGHAPADLPETMAHLDGNWVATGGPATTAASDNAVGADAGGEADYDNGDQSATDAGDADYATAESNAYGDPADTAGGADYDNGGGYDTKVDYDTANEYGDRSAYGDPNDPSALMVTSI